MRYGDTAYPVQIGIRGRGGDVKVTAFGPHDILTVNEIFFRGDYETKGRPAVVMDCGSNVGISMLYFLSRNPACHVYGFEPWAPNLRRLRSNLARHQHRYQVDERCVGPSAGTVLFEAEPTGRYGRIADDGLPTPCIGINEAAAPIIQRHGRIDVLKLDIEGAERETILALTPTTLSRVACILAETPGMWSVPGFTASRYGPILQLTNNSLTI